MIASHTALLVILAMASTASAFVLPSHRSTSVQLSNDLQLLHEVIMNSSAEVKDEGSAAYDSHSSTSTDPPTKLIMDIPPPPSVSLGQQAVDEALEAQTKKTKPYTVVKTKPGKPFNPAHKEGILSPLVYAANKIMGKEELNKLRAQIISLHSDIIKSFVDTSDSTFGKAVLRQLFDISDTDNSGYLDKNEVQNALELLGFKWLQEKHVQKIFERADLNEDGEISLEEFMEEAPKTLKVNLVKLAKNNGGDLGLLV